MPFMRTEQIGSKSDGHPTPHFITFQFTPLSIANF